MASLDHRYLGVPRAYPSPLDSSGRAGGHQVLCSWRVQAVCTDKEVQTRHYVKTKVYDKEKCDLEPWHYATIKEGVTG